MTQTIIEPKRTEPWVLPDGRPTLRFAKWAESITLAFNGFVVDVEAESSDSMAIQGYISNLRKRICKIEKEL